MRRWIALLAAVMLLLAGTAYAGTWVIDSAQIGNQVLNKARLKLAGALLKLETGDGGYVLSTSKMSLSGTYTLEDGTYTFDLGTLTEDGDTLTGKLTVFGIPMQVTFVRDADAQAKDSTADDHDPRVTCPKCNGTGFVTCSYCHGEGDVCMKCWGDGEYQGETCSECSGSGKAACPKCGWTGVTTCPTCKGGGFVYEDD